MQLIKDLFVDENIEEMDYGEQELELFFTQSADTVVPGTINSGQGSHEKITGHYLSGSYKNRTVDTG